MFLIEMPSDFAKPISMPAVCKHLFHHRGGNLVNDKFVLIVRMCLVAVWHVAAKIIAQLGVGLFHCFDFFAGVFALELVEEIPKRHNIVVAVDGIHAVIKGDKPHPDHREQVVCELT